MAAELHGVRVRLLGPVRAWRNGIELTLGSARRQAVFSVLALHANQPVSREELVNAVWGDSPPASATGNVYTYISALRQVLEPELDRPSTARLLTSGGGSYCLHVDEGDVDALRFDELREQSRRHRMAGDRQGELSTVHSALELWQDMWYGEALAGIPGPYADAQRLRLGELRLATLERHAALMLDLDRHDDVVAGLHNLVERYPLRENLHALLITALHRTGRRAEALEVHRKLRELLIEEAGTEPSAALRNVHSQILSGSKIVSGWEPAEIDAAEPTAPAPDVMARDTATPGAATLDAVAPAVVAPAPGSAEPLVGRDRELARLRSAVTGVAAGRGSSLWIEGEAGIGKTALLTEGLRGAAPAGCHVGWGIGDELAQRMPLSVLLECFDLQGCDDAEDLVRALGAAAGEGAADPGWVLLDQVLTLIERARADSPLVLVVDDMQWADEATLLVWRSLHQLTRRLPLLLVAAARPLPQTGQLNVLRRLLVDQGVETMHLPSLTPDDAAEVVRRLDPATTTVDAIVTAAAGNPYYLRRLVVAGANSGTPPPALVTAVGVHLDMLTEETRQILRAIAFLGDDCTVSEIAAVTGRPAPELVRAIEEALVGGFLAESERRLTFRHPVVRRVLHDGTPTALRIMLHSAFAEKVAQLAREPEPVVA